MTCTKHTHLRPIACSKTAQSFLLVIVSMLNGDLNGLRILPHHATRFKL